MGPIVFFDLTSSYEQPVHVLILSVICFIKFRNYFNVWKLNFNHKDKSLRDFWKVVQWKKKKLETRTWGYLYSAVYHEKSVTPTNWTKRSLYLKIP